MFSAVNAMHGFAFAPKAALGAEWVDLGATGLTYSSYASGGGFGLGKLWNLAPSNSSFGSRVVESSVDGGSSWSHVSSTLPLGSHDGSSSGISSGSFPFVVFDNKLWVIFGDAGSNWGWAENAVHHTTDGITWTTISTPVGGIIGRYRHAGCAHNGKIIISGGDNYYYGKSKDVWTTVDGATFTQKTANAPWDARHGHAMLSWNGKLWLFGGRGAGGVSGYYNDVWSSDDDGASWVNEAPNASFSARHAFGACVADGKMWLVGGYTVGGTPSDEVWSTSDGTTWLLSPGVPGVSGGAQGCALASTDGLTLTAFGGSGLGSGGSSSCWRST